VLRPHDRQGPPSEGRPRRGDRADLLPLLEGVPPLPAVEAGQLEPRGAALPGPDLQGPGAEEPVDGGTGAPLRAAVRGAHVRLTAVRSAVRFRGANRGRRSLPGRDRGRPRRRPFPAGGAYAWRVRRCPGLGWLLESAG